VTTSTIFLLLSVVAASAVEMVEAMTILLASGISRGWRSTMEGALVAFLVLMAIVAIAGPALVNYVPINTLRLVVGTLLLIFGLQWLHKAILRASGYKALHDETLIYQKEVNTLSKAPKFMQGKRDPIAFTVSFKGVFLEGMEVVIIVISFGVPAQQLTLSAIAAIATMLVVGIVGAKLSRPLAKMPENSMKLGVGLILTVFGTFWMGEGAGIEWPEKDLFLIVLLVVFAAVVLGFIKYFRQTKPSTRPEVQVNV
jgi:uncharacterized membrane protein